MTPDPTAAIDARFSDPEAGPTPWSDANPRARGGRAVLAHDGPRRRPAARDPADRRDPGRGVVHFCTGLREQKARNLEHNAQVALTTGTNTWAAGPGRRRRGDGRPRHRARRPAAPRRRLRGQVRKRLALRGRRRRLRRGARTPPRSSGSSRSRSWPSPSGRTRRPRTGSARREADALVLAGLHDQRRAGRHLVPDAGEVAERLGDDRARLVGEASEPLVVGIERADRAGVGAGRTAS